MMPMEESIDSAPAPSSPSDFSLTNVQVLGVDELDVVKVDSQTGTELYVLNGDVVNFMNAFPPEDLELYSDTETNSWADGIYEHEDLVIAISYDMVEAFYKEDGSEAWTLKLNSSYVNSRMVDGVIYLVLQEYPYAPYRPMPLERCVEDLCVAVTIDYPDIYIPTGVSSEVFYDIISIDAVSGGVIDAQAFMGPYSSTLYMSRTNIYVGMHETKDEMTVLFDYLSNEGKGILSDEIDERIEYLNSLDISDEAKTLEFMLALERWMADLSPEGAAIAFNNLDQGYNAYVADHPERVEYTGIAKMGYSSSGVLSAPETGIVPGRLLNQFAMDEYNGDLRAAVTYGRWDDAENGVIVLDTNMNEAGRVIGLAEGERIYAVRFMGATGYVVTFRETDPLYVLDLSDPANPEVKGELKVPGYSTYLHMVGEGQLLGIGEEDWNVKLSLFDVSDPENPTELDTFIMDEYWSEALYNHHAFLHYPAMELVILPIGSQDYIFRVRAGQISLRKIIDEDAVRNVYMDEYLYVITYDDVIVYSLDNYDEISREKLEGYSGRYWYDDDVWIE